MEAMKKPCQDCPWRKSNQGKPHSHGWYTIQNRRRLWAGLRTGEAPGMTCHPTDPNNDVPDGHRTPPKGSQAKECAGALLLVQRELNRFQKDPKGYCKARGRRGLSKEGIAWWGFSRCALAGTPLGGDSMPMIKEDPDILFEGLI